MGLIIDLKLSIPTEVNQHTADLLRPYIKNGRVDLAALPFNADRALSNEFYERLNGLPWVSFERADVLSDDPYTDEPCPACGAAAGEPCDPTALEDFDEEN